VSDINAFALAIPDVNAPKTASMFITFKYHGESAAALVTALTASTAASALLATADACDIFIPNLFKPINSFSCSPTIIS